MTRIRVIVVAVLLGLLAIPTAAAARPPRGALAPLSGAGGCLGPGPGCAPLRGPIGLVSLAISPDGRNLYAVGQAGGLAILLRDPRTGSMRQPAGRAGCVRADGRQGCTRLHGFSGPGAIAISADGRDVYVTTASGIQIFARKQSTGALRANGCIDAARTGCALLRAPVAPTSLLAAGNGTVYAAGTVSDAAGNPIGALAVLTRNRATGALRQPSGSAGCLDGDGSYGCTGAPCIDQTTSMTLAGGGGRLYIGSTDSLNPEATAVGDVATFARNRGTGALTELGCQSRMSAIADIAAIPRAAGVLVTTLFGDRGTGRAWGSLDAYRPGSDGVLRRVRKLACLPHTACPIPYDTGAARLALTPRGDTVYVAMDFGGVTVLHRGAHGVSLLPGRAGCIVSVAHFSPPSRCALEGPEIGEDLLVSPDGRTLYLATLGLSKSQYYRGGVEAFAIAP